MSLVLMLCLATGRPAATVAQPDVKTITDAYVYLLGRVLVIRQEHMDRAGEDFAYNRIKYNPLGPANFANPNFDVAYLEAWIAAHERTPVVLEVPQVKGRYYTAQILDEWAEVITDVNERTFPTKKFAFVAPGWKGELPADVVRIDLHSRKAKLLGRVELKGDPQGAVALQKAFKLAPLGNPVIEPPTSFATTFGQADMPGVEIFDNLDPKLITRVRGCSLALDAIGQTLCEALDRFDDRRRLA